MGQTKYERCPCGKIPMFLSPEGVGSRIGHVSGICCNEWSIEFKNDFADGEAFKQNAEIAWNNASRAKPVAKDMIARGLTVLLDDLDERIILSDRIGLDSVDELVRLCEEEDQLRLPLK